MLFAEFQKKYTFWFSYVIIIITSYGTSNFDIISKSTRINCNVVIVAKELAHVLREWFFHTLSKTDKKQFQLSSTNKNIKNRLNLELLKISRTVISTFSSVSGFYFSEIENKKLQKGYSYKRKIITVTKNLKGLSEFLQPLPLINPPRDWTVRGKQGGFFLNDQGIEKLIIPMRSGIHKLKITAEVLKKINVLQKKPYRISKQVLEILINIENPEYLCFRKELNLLTSEEFNDLCKQLIELKQVYKTQISEHIDLKLKWEKYKSEVRKKSKNHLDEKKINLQLNAQYVKDIKPALEKYLPIIKKKIELEENIQKAHGAYLRWIHIVQVARIFQNKTLYFSTKMDFRGRIYPSSSLFSRTSGVYKYLLEDAYGAPLTEKGFEVITMVLFINLKKYYHLVGHWSTEYEYKQLNIQERVQDLFTRFKTPGEFLKYLNDIDYYSTGKKDYIQSTFFYTYLLFYELWHYYNPEKNTISWTNNLTRNCHFKIELDQRNSGLQILALLASDIILQKDSITNPGKSVYFKIQNKYKEYFFEQSDKSIPFNLPKSIWHKLWDIFTDRSVIKKMVMCGAYSESVFGRASRISQENIITQSWILEDLKKSNIPWSRFQQALFFLCKKYDTFMLTEYPKTIKYKQQVENLAKIFTKNNNAIRWVLFDGLQINYTYLKKNKQRAYYYDYISNSYIQFKVAAESDQIDLEKHSLAFLPNFIQSLDGFYIREIGYNIFKILGYIPETLHDSIAVHPNYITKCRAIIWKAYFENRFTAASETERYLNYQTFLLSPNFDMSNSSLNKDEVKQEYEKLNKIIEEKQDLSGVLIVTSDALKIPKSLIQDYDTNFFTKIPSYRLHSKENLTTWAFTYSLKYGRFMYNF